MKVKWICGKCGKKRGSRNPKKAGWQRFVIRGCLGEHVIIIRCKECAAKM